MADDRAVVAVDVGGTTIKAGVLGPSGLHDLRRVPTRRERGPDSVLDTVAHVVVDLLDRCAVLDLDAVGIGVVVPGIVDDAGVGRYSVTMGWRDLPLRDRLVATIGRPVHVGHDVRAGASAEAAFGAAALDDSALFLSIGTGICAAFVRDGVVLTGAAFQAGELGQLLVKAPRTGAAEGGVASVTLEATSSARAIAEGYARATGCIGSPVGADVVAAAVAAGDRHATAVWNEAVDRLGSVVAGAIAAIDPGVIVVGGGLSRAGDTLVEPLVASIATHLPWREPPRVTTARFADDAGFVGCAIDAWHHSAGFEVSELAWVLGADDWRTVVAAIEV